MMQSEEFSQDYTETAQQVRADILLMTHAAGSGHPGSSFSSTDLLVWLYYEEMNISKPDDPDRDRLVLSKGHACPALYSILSRKGFFDREELWNLRKTGALLQGHASMDIPGVEFSSGSLGQGLSFAVGVSLGGRLDDRPNSIFVIIGDGELQEGQVWEAMMQAGDKELNEIVAIVERNGIQNDDLVEETLSLGQIEDKFASFGWSVSTCDGHDYQSIRAAFRDLDHREGPGVIIADTVKGKGVSFMEADRLGYHSQVLTPEEMETALTELSQAERIGEME